MRQGLAPNLGELSRMCAAAHRNILVACWRERVTAEDVRALFPVTDEMLVRLISRRARPTRLTASLADAAAWQAPLLGEPDGETIDAAALETFANDLLTAFRERAEG